MVATKTFPKKRVTGNRERVTGRMPKVICREQDAENIKEKLRKINEQAGEYAKLKTQLYFAQNEAYRKLFNDYLDCKESIENVIWQDPQNAECVYLNDYIDVWYCGYVDVSYGEPTLIILQYFGEFDSKETSKSIALCNKWRKEFNEDVIDQKDIDEDIEKTNNILRELVNCLKPY